MNNSNRVRADGNCELCDVWNEELAVCMQDEDLGGTCMVMNQGLMLIHGVSNFQEKDRSIALLYTWPLHLTASTDIR